MRHKSIYKKAQFVDKFVDHYNNDRKRTSFSHQAVGTLVELLFPKCEFLGKGAFKTAFYIPSRNEKKDLVLKVGKEKSIKTDYYKVYMSIKSPYIRNNCFAKIYWHTKHCLLQKWGKQIKLSKKDPRLVELKEKLKPYGLTDIRAANVGMVGGRLKVLDACTSKRKSVKSI